MRAVIYIKDENLITGNLCLDRNIIRAFWNEELESIEVYSKSKKFLESYYGDGLEKLILSAIKAPSSTAVDYYLAKRWVLEQ